MTALLVLVPLVPLVWALALFLPRLEERARRSVPWAAVPALAVAAFGVEGRLGLPWLGLGLRLEMAPEGRLFLLFGAVVWAVAAGWARTDLMNEGDGRRVSFFLLLAMAGALTLPLAADPFGYLTGSALMTFAGYGLIQRGSDPATRRAGLTYIILLVVADVLLFEALLLHAGDGPPKPLFAVLAAAGFGIKAGLAPLHVWLPLAYRVVPVTAAMALAAGHVGAAVLGWQRFLPAVSVPLPALAETVAVLGLAAVVLGLALGLLQRNPKVLLAYAGVAQVGVVALATSTALADPAVWQRVQPLLGLYAVHYLAVQVALLLAIPMVDGVQGQAARRRVLAGIGLAAVFMAGVPFSAGGDVHAHLTGLWSARPETAPPFPELLLPLFALGMAALTVRLVGLLWQRLGSSPGPVPSRGWAVLLGALAVAGPLGRVLLGVEVPRAFETWPLLVGAVVALPFLALRLPERPRIPAGDIVTLYAGILAALHGLLRGVDRASDALAAAGRSGMLRGASVLLAGAVAAVRMEGVLLRWTIGTALLVVLLTLLLLLLLFGP